MRTPPLLPAMLMACVTPPTVPSDTDLNTDTVATFCGEPVVDLPVRIRGASFQDDYNSSDAGSCLDAFNEPIAAFAVDLPRMNRVIVHDLRADTS